MAEWIDVHPFPLVHIRLTYRKKQNGTAIKRLSVGIIPKTPKTTQLFQFVYAMLVVESACRSTILVQTEVP